MGNWTEFSISEFVEINPKVPLKKGIEYSFVEMKDLNEARKFALPSNMRNLGGGSRFENGDTLFARITPCLENGKICQVKGLNDEVGFGSTEFIVFRGKKGVSISDYVYYLMSSPAVRKFAESRMIGTSGRQRVPKEAFDDLVLPLPSLSEQFEITQILSALDEKIENNLAMNRTLEEMAMTLYKHWFMDVDAEEQVIIEEYIQLSPRLSVKKGTVVPFVEMKALPTNAMSVSEVAERAFTSGSKFQNNDTLFARITPCLENGKTAFVDFLEEDQIAFGSTEFLVFRAKEGVSPYYNYCLARDESFRKHAVSCMAGTSGRQRVQNEPLMRYEVNKVSRDVMKSFNEKVAPLFAQIRANTLENQTLAQLRDTLLPKLISGEVRLKEVEEMVG
jgi:type I restriction enzyme, S subunit